MTKLSALDIRLQLRYVEAKINRYTRMRELINNQQPKKMKKANITHNRTNPKNVNAKIKVEPKNAIKNEPDCEESSIDNISELKSITNL